jgi:hypothetical protein
VSASFRASIVGVGTCAPGMIDWAAARDVLCGRCEWRPEPLPKLDVPLLPSTERRRVNAAARLAIAAATQAVAAWPVDRRPSLASVFATGNGDGEVLAGTLQTLVDDATAMSPTLFHNSVFNAPAGYWTIANRSRARSTTVSAAAGSFAAGVLEATVEVAMTRAPVLMVAADMPFPASLAAFDVTGAAFAAALLLSPPDDSTACSFGTLEIAVHAGSPRPTGDDVDPAIATAFRGNPAALALPLLAAIARAAPSSMDLPYVEGCHVRMAFTP